MRADLTFSLSRYILVTVSEFAQDEGLLPIRTSSQTGGGGSLAR